MTECFRKIFRALDGDIIIVNFIDINIHDKVYAVIFLSKRKADC